MTCTEGFTFRNIPNSRYIVIAFKNPTNEIQFHPMIIHGNYAEHPFSVAFVLQALLIRFEPSGSSYFLFNVSPGFP